MYTVYMLRVPDGRVYIGTTSMNIHERWNNGNGYRFCEPLWNIIAEIGWENIEKTILKGNLSEEEACLFEQKMIIAFESTDPDHGFNREGGGVLKRKIVTDESRKRMSQSKMGAKNPNFGTHFSEERKRKLSESNRGQKRSKETCRKIGLSKSKPVYQYTTSGVLIGEFISAVEAEKETGVSRNAIRKAAVGKTKTGGGYIWKH